MPINDFLNIQSGKESAWAVAASASAKRMAWTEFKLSPRGKSKIYKEIRGNLARGFLAGKMSIAADLHGAGYGSCEDLPYLMDAMFGIATPSAFPANPPAIAISSSTNATPIVVTTAVAHGLS